VSSQVPLGPIHTTTEEFENEGFTLKTQQMYLKMQQSPVNVYLYLRKTRSRESHDYRDVIDFEKLGVFKFPRFEERFSKSSVFLTD